MLYANGGPTEHSAHPSKYPQGHFKTKPCRWCKEDFQPLSPCHMLCSHECRDRQHTARYLKRVYGLEYSEYIDMYNKSNGTCYMCGSEGFRINKNARLKLAVDHCHKTGDVRGLLCHNCNRALCLLQDDVEILKVGIEYLEGATTIPKGSTLK